MDLKDTGSLREYRTKREHLATDQEVAQTCQAVQYGMWPLGEPTMGGYPIPAGVTDLTSWVVLYPGEGVCVYTDAEFRELYEPC